LCWRHGGSKHHEWGHFPTPADRRALLIAAANLRRVGSVGSKTPGKVSGDDDHHKRTSDADEPPTINPPLRALTERLRAIAAAYKLFLFDDNSRS